MTNLLWMLQDVNKSMCKSMETKILEILVDEEDEGVVLDEVAVRESVVADSAVGKPPQSEVEQIMLEPVMTAYLK